MKLNTARFRAKAKHGLWSIVLAAMATSAASSVLITEAVNPAAAASNSGTSSGLSADVTINPSATLNTVPSTAFGLNTAVYDGYLTDPKLPPLLKADGAEMLRYPGGSTSDSYNWETNSIITGSGCTNCGGYANPNNNFSSFMKVAQSAGAQPIITVNYGTGTPQLAAAWVQDANVTNNYNIKYWEVGNEVYGDGVYGASWEAINRTGLGPRTYANNALSYIQAMKAVDPNINVGVVLTTPGDWPDGIVLSGQTLDWNQTVLSTVGSEAGFVIIHWYPNQTSESTFYNSLSVIPNTVAQVRALLEQYDGQAVGSKIPIFVTETNSSINNVPYAFTSHEAGVFAPFDELGWIASGAANVDWWDVHNGIGTPSVDPTTGVMNYNDMGILSNGTCSGSVCEPTSETPFPPYYGLEMLKYFTSTGDSIVTATSNQSSVAAYGSISPSGQRSVILGNESNSTYQVNLSGIAASSSANATVYTYNPALNSGITQTQSATATVTLPPFSVIVVDSTANTSSGSTTTAAPTTTTAAPVTTTTAAPTTTTAAPVSTTAAPTSTTSAPVSTTSAPVSTTSAPTSTTAAPVITSSCGVTMTIGSQWAGGFTANVTVSAGSSALSSWTVGFNLPSGAAITNSWSAVITTSGSSVTATNESYNGLLAAGQSTSFGFQGTDTGTISPATVSCA